MCVCTGNFKEAQLLLLPATLCNLYTNIMCNVSSHGYVLSEGNELPRSSEMTKK